jgi:hypothetical protein
MKNFLLNVARVIIILISAGVVFYAAKSSVKDLALVFAGAIFRDFLSDKVYAPIFGYESAQGWVLRQFKKKPKTKITVDIPKWDI